MHLVMLSCGISGSRHDLIFCLSIISAVYPDNPLAPRRASPEPSVSGEGKGKGKGKGKKKKAYDPNDSECLSKSFHKLIFCLLFFPLVNFSFSFRLSV